MSNKKARFLSRLEAGHKTEDFVERMLVSAGIEVERPQMPEGASTRQFTKYQIDMIANGYILEIKGRGVRFDDVANYPYPTLFVESKSGFDAKVQTPDFYVSVSNLTGAIICLDVAATRDYWSVQMATDRRYGYHYEMYIAEKELWMNWDEFIGVIS